MSMANGRRLAPVNLQDGGPYLASIKKTRAGQNKPNGTGSKLSRPEETCKVCNLQRSYPGAAFGPLITMASATVRMPPSGPSMLPGNIPPLPALVQSSGQAESDEKAGEVMEDAMTHDENRFSVRKEDVLNRYLAKVKAKRLRKEAAVKMKPIKVTKNRSAKSSSQQSPKEHISEMAASGPRTYLQSDLADVSINTKIPSPTPATTEVPTISELVRSSEPQEDTTQSDGLREQVVVAEITDDTPVEQESSMDRVHRLDDSSVSSVLQVKEKQPVTVMTMQAIVHGTDDPAEDHLVPTFTRLSEVISERTSPFAKAAHSRSSNDHRIPKSSLKAILEESGAWKEETAPLEQVIESMMGLQRQAYQGSYFLEELVGPGYPERPRPVFLPKVMRREFYDMIEDDGSDAMDILFKLILDRKEKKYKPVRSIDDYTASQDLSFQPSGFVDARVLDNSNSHESNLTPAGEALESENVTEAAENQSTSLFSISQTPAPTHVPKTPLAIKEARALRSLQEMKTPSQGAATGTAMSLSSMWTPGLTTASTAKSASQNVSNFQTVPEDFSLQKASAASMQDGTQYATAGLTFDYTTSLSGSASRELRTPEDYSAPIVGSQVPERAGNDRVPQEQVELQRRSSTFKVDQTPSKQLLNWGNSDVGRIDIGSLDDAKATQESSRMDVGPQSSKESLNTESGSAKFTDQKALSVQTTPNKQSSSNLKAEDVESLSKKESMTKVFHTDITVAQKEPEMGHTFGISPVEDQEDKEEELYSDSFKPFDPKSVNGVMGMAFGSQFTVDEIVTQSTDKSEGQNDAAPLPIIQNTGSDVPGMAYKFESLSVPDPLIVSNATADQQDVIEDRLERQRSLVMAEILDDRPVGQLSPDSTSMVASLTDSSPKKVQLAAPVARQDAYEELLKNSQVSLVNSTRVLQGATDKDMESKASRTPTAFQNEAAGNKGSAGIPFSLTVSSASPTFHREEIPESSGVQVIGYSESESSVAFGDKKESQTLGCDGKMVMRGMGKPAHISWKVNVSHEEKLAGEALKGQQGASSDKSIFHGLTTPAHIVTEDELTTSMQKASEEEIRAHVEPAEINEVRTPTYMQSVHEGSPVNDQESFPFPQVGPGLPLDFQVDAMGGAPEDAEEGLYSDGKPTSSSHHSHLLTASSERDEGVSSSTSTLHEVHPVPVTVQVAPKKDSDADKGPDIAVGAILGLSPGLPAPAPESSGETTKNSQPPSFFPQQGELKVLQCVDIPSFPHSDKVTSSSANGGGVHGMSNMGHARTLTFSSDKLVLNKRDEFNFTSAGLGAQEFNDNKGQNMNIVFNGGRGQTEDHQSDSEAEPQSLGPPPMPIMPISSVPIKATGCPVCKDQCCCNDKPTSTSLSSETEDLLTVSAPARMEHVRRRTRSETFEKKKPMRKTFTEGHIEVEAMDHTTVHETTTIPTPTDMRDTQKLPDESRNSDKAREPGEKKSLLPKKKSATETLTYIPPAFTPGMMSTTQTAQKQAAIENLEGEVTVLQLGSDSKQEDKETSSNMSPPSANDKDVVEQRTDVELHTHSCPIANGPAFTAATSLETADYQPRSLEQPRSSAADVAIGGLNAEALDMQLPGTIAARLPPTEEALSGESSSQAPEMRQGARHSEILRPASFAGLINPVQTHSSEDKIHELLQKVPDALESRDKEEKVEERFVEEEIVESVKPTKRILDSPEGGKVENKKQLLAKTSSVNYSLETSDLGKAAAVTTTGTGPTKTYATRDEEPPMDEDSSRSTMEQISSIHKTNETKASNIDFDSVNIGSKEHLNASNDKALVKPTRRSSASKYFDTVKEMVTSGVSSMMEKVPATLAKSCECLGKSSACKTCQGLVKRASKDSGQCPSKRSQDKMDKANIRSGQSSKLLIQQESKESAPEVKGSPRDDVQEADQQLDLSLFKPNKMDLLSTSDQTLTRLIVTDTSADRNSEKKATKAKTPQAPSSNADVLALTEETLTASGVSSGRPTTDLESEDIMKIVLDTKPPDTSKDATIAPNSLTTVSMGSKGAGKETKGLSKRNSAEEFVQKILRKNQQVARMKIPKLPKNSLTDIHSRPGPKAYSSDKSSEGVASNGDDGDRSATSEPSRNFLESGRVTPRLSGTPEAGRSPEIADKPTHYKEEKQSKSSSGIDADERVFGTPSEHRSRNVVLSPLGPELRSVSTNEGGLTRDLKLPMVDREEAEKWLPADPRKSSATADKSSAHTTSQVSKAKAYTVGRDEFGPADTSSEIPAANDDFLQEESPISSVPVSDDLNLNVFGSDDLATGSIGKSLESIKGGEAAKKESSVFRPKHGGSNNDQPGEEAPTTKGPLDNAFKDLEADHSDPSDFEDGTQTSGRDIRFSATGPMEPLVGANKPTFQEEDTSTDAVSEDINDIPDFQNQPRPRSSTGTVAPPPKEESNEGQQTGNTFLKSLASQSSHRTARSSLVYQLSVSKQPQPEGHANDSRLDIDSEKGPLEKENLAFTDSHTSGLGMTHNSTENTASGKWTKAHKKSKLAQALKASVFNRDSKDNVMSTSLGTTTKGSEKNLSETVANASDDVLVRLAPVKTMSRLSEPAFCNCSKEAFDETCVCEEAQEEMAKDIEMARQLEILGSGLKALKSVSQVGPPSNDVSSMSVSSSILLPQVSEAAMKPDVAPTPSYSLYMQSRSSLFKPMSTERVSSSSAGKDSESGDHALPFIPRLSGMYADHPKYKKLFDQVEQDARRRANLRPKVAKKPPSDDYDNNVEWTLPNTVKAKPEEPPKIDGKPVMQLGRLYSQIADGYKGRVDHGFIVEYVSNPTKGPMSEEELLKDIDLDADGSYPKNLKFRWLTRPYDPNVPKEELLAPDDPSMDVLEAIKKKSRVYLTDESRAATPRKHSSRNLHSRSRTRSRSASVSRSRSRSRSHSRRHSRSSSAVRRRKRKSSTSKVIAGMSKSGTIRLPALPTDSRHHYRLVQLTQTAHVEKGGPVGDELKSRSSRSRSKSRSRSLSRSSTSRSRTHV